MTAAPDGVSVREAAVPELPDVLNVLDGSGLQTDAGQLRRALGGGDRDAVLVAVAGDGERVLGALALDGERITAVAVRRRRRGQEIGTELVEAAADLRDRLVAECDADVRRFWEGVGFDVTGTDRAGRYRGVQS